MERIAIIESCREDSLSDLIRNVTEECAKKLSRRYFVDILLTRTSLPEEEALLSDRTRVKTFHLSHYKDEAKFTSLSLLKIQQLSSGIPTEKDEDLNWIRELGPVSQELETYIAEKREEYKAFVFLDCMNYITIQCLPQVAEKSVLIPLVEDDLWLGQSIFHDLFSLPRCFVFLTKTERDFVYRTYHNSYIPSAFIENISSAADFVIHGRVDGMLFGLHFLSAQQAENNNRNIYADAPMPAEIICVDRRTVIEPAFDENEVCAVFVSNESFAKYLGVLIYSVIVHCSADRNYHLVILTDDMSRKTMNRIVAMAKDMPNVKIQFVDVNTVMTSEKVQIEGENYTKHTYYRLLLPDLMKHHKKVLYLDADVLVNADIAQLFDEDVTGCHMAGTYDVLITAWQSFPNEMRDYFKSQGLTEIGEYMQAGVVLFHLEEMRKDFKPGFLLERAEKEKHIFNDQDLLNLYSKGRIKIVGVEWNVLALGDESVTTVQRWLPEDLYQEYIRARSAPKIVHYADQQRPGRSLDFDMCDLYWSYARKTPFYELLINSTR